MKKTLVSFILVIILALSLTPAATYAAATIDFESMTEAEMVEWAKTADINRLDTSQEAKLVNMKLVYTKHWYYDGQEIPEETYNRIVKALDTVRRIRNSEQTVINNPDET